ncbi:hypothetical protein MXB_3784, partial [Myxobolus squamalis]
MIEMLSPSKNQAHTSLMLMATYGRIIYNFTDPEGYSLLEARNTISYLQQSKAPTTCLGNALYRANMAMFYSENIRSDSYKALMVLSDGKDNCESKLAHNFMEEATRIKQRGIIIFSVGIVFARKSIIILQPARKLYTVHLTNSDEDVEKTAHCNARLLFQLDSTFKNPQEYQKLVSYVDEMIKYFMSRFNHDQNQVTSKTSVIVYDERPTIIWDFDAEEATNYNLAAIKLKSISNKP